MLELLDELNREEGHTIVIVTHDPAPPRSPAGSSSCATAASTGSRKGGSAKRLLDRIAS